MKIDTPLLYHDLNDMATLTKAAEAIGFDGMLDRVSYHMPFVSGENDEGWRQTVAGFKM